MIISCIQYTLWIRITYSICTHNVESAFWSTIKPLRPMNNDECTFPQTSDFNPSKPAPSRRWPSLPRSEDPATGRPLHEAIRVGHPVASCHTKSLQLWNLQNIKKILSHSYNVHQFSDFLCSSCYLYLHVICYETSVTLHVQDQLDSWLNILSLSISQPFQGTLCSCHPCWLYSPTCRGSPHFGSIPRLALLGISGFQTRRPR